MSATPISRSADLAKLEAEGFRLRIVQKSAHHLLVENVPSVNAKGEVIRGTLYSPLELDADGKTVNPVQNHQCWWIGEAPCDAKGRLMSEMISNGQPEDKGDGITTTVAFSRKHVDQTPYRDYHEKTWEYVRLIWHEARVIDPMCDPRTDKPIPAIVQAVTQAFRYPDMATTRAGIGAATAKLAVDKVVIVGLGGSGGYTLDLVAKAPAKSIHIYDREDFELPNAFRTPGAPAKDYFEKPMRKVDWFGNIYDRMHAGIVRHPYHVTAENLDELLGADVVFIAIDDSDARKIIVDGLVQRGIDFIDMGMDVDLDPKGSLRGQCRFTVGTQVKTDHLYDAMPLAKGPDNGVYRNIQVADLNMLNAALAVGKWKKMRGFYADDLREHHALYTVATSALAKDDLS